MLKSTHNYPPFFGAKGILTCILALSAFCFKASCSEDGTDIPRIGGA